MIQSLADIKRHLQSGFTEQQTELLATCIYESYEPLVTKREMADLRAVVADVAESQKRLAAAQTEMHEDIEGLVRVTTEVVWGIGDLRKQMGGIARSVGQGLEAYAMDRIPRLLEERYGFVTASAAPETVGPVNDATDIDIVYRGTHDGRPVAVLCAVKTNISETEVREFLATVARVRPHVGVDDVRTLIFCYRTSEPARRLIAEYGCLLAFPRGLQ